MVVSEKIFPDRFRCELLGNSFHGSSLVVFLARYVGISRNVKRNGKDFAELRLAVRFLLAVNQRKGLTGEHI